MPVITGTFARFCVRVHTGKVESCLSLKIMTHGEQRANSWKVFFFLCCVKEMENMAIVIYSKPQHMNCATLASLGRVEQVRQRWFWPLDPHVSFSDVSYSHMSAETEERVLPGVKWSTVCPHVNRICTNFHLWGSNMFAFLTFVFNWFIHQLKRIREAGENVHSTSEIRPKMAGTCCKMHDMLNPVYAEMHRCLRIVVLCLCRSSIISW